ncbi:hypothetical protein CB0940_10253 [Cercospora beticola]|uniref:Uncharacterized protein n=1 Tax=Cercospora beticola TaxID=122368 RepID=A0A2G5HUP7_CERBT|nr:hypothetical protein CB0940_10253 [Cercospora beticola]PIA95962.1 hypothetical protein CB0940_10253 [Cercospora beticola]WPB06961.1 hypothetical protein RHO25_011621 [Cercospora beticola]CAK1366888.1 unnamed protein product [Cercospora beticola]
MSLRATIVLSLSALAVALPQDDNDFVYDPNTAVTCPDGWSANTGNGGDPNTYCCPGQSIADFTPGGIYGCAIGSTTIPFTMAGYTSIVSSLAAQESGGAVESESMGTTVMVSSSAEETSMATEDTETTSMGSESSSSGAGGAQATESSTTSSGNGAAMMTAAPMLGAAALAMLAL